MRPINWKTVMLLGASVVAGVGLSYAMGFDPVRVYVDKDAGQVWPAWVQAFGSIGAILAAAFIARWQRRAELAQKRDDDLANARSMAALLYKDFVRWKEKATPREQYNPLFGVDLHAIPQQIYDCIRDLHVMGPASGPATKAIGFSLKAREIGGPSTDGTKRFLRTDESQAEYSETLKQIQSSCDQVIREFDKLLGLSSRT